MAAVEAVSSRESSFVAPSFPWISALCRTLSLLSPDPWSVLEAESEVPLFPEAATRGVLSSGGGLILTRVTRFNPGGRRWWRLCRSCCDLHDSLAPLLAGGSS